VWAEQLDIKGFNRYNYTIQKCYITHTIHLRIYFHRCDLKIQTTRVAVSKRELTTLGLCTCLHKGKLIKVAHKYSVKNTRCEIAY
jgi:hypothetical protein